MGRSAAMVVPRDEELSWGFQCAESVLGRASAFREGGGGSGSNDYERRITDRRFSFEKDAPAEVERARAFFARIDGIAPEHRDVLALAYGLPAEVLAAQVVAASNLECWAAVFKVYGNLAAVALYLAPRADEIAPRREDLERGGVWASATGKHLRAFCKAWKHPGPRAACEECIKVTPKACAVHVECQEQKRVADALHAALEASGHDWGNDKAPRAPREYKWQAPEAVRPERIVAYTP